MYDTAYCHSSPKPCIAQQIHRALQKTSIESEPHIGKQSEISIANGQLTNEQVAETIKNENGINFVLPDGETYRSLLMEARANLQLLCDQAKNDLLNRIHLIQFILIPIPIRGFVLAIFSSQALEYGYCFSIFPEEEMPEHAAGTLRTAIGKAGLLLDRKMTKFEDLLKNHLNQNSDVGQVNLSDLSGYWALISIELKELEANFREINFLRENHWTLSEAEFRSVSTVGDNRGENIKKVQSHLPVINSEKIASEVQRRQIALAAAKRRQKELKKAEEEQYAERNNDGEVRMVI
ncbi:unnamed protein product [Wuchereria bancrofti]|uniref:Uncharacterized protein n=1 Tax=Wuchereria bancrofti TaxID=6293 RepID=A0A3P7EQ67_WUCBA|nr:unnamed protein product [Wuchereria bancrofti]